MTAVAASAGPTAPTRGLVLAIAAAALAAGLGVGAIIATSDHMADRTAWAVFGPLVAWCFVGTGLYAWRRRPDSRFGLLMTLLGFAWTLAGLQAADAPVAFTAGIVLGSLWGPVLAHTLLGFPSGRLATRGQRVLVAAAYVVVPLAPVPAMLFTRSDDLIDCAGPCPENLLLVTPDERLGDALLATGSLAVMALALVAVWLLVAKWRVAGPAERRGLAPLLAAGGAALLCVVLQVATASPVFEWLTLAAFAVTPFAFVGGLARTDVLRSRGVRTLVGRLADLPRRENLRDALATALGDPTVRLAFWVPEQGRYVDAGGERAELPGAADLDRAVTEVERDGRRVAAIVHDRALCDDPETVRAVGAATALLLENQRLEAELRARIVELRASRARLVEAGDTERRRLERNLHDGAQSRLVALALDLRLARARFDDGSAAAALVDGWIDEVRASLDDLRELARGIHPAVLSDRGLEPAVRSLAARAPVPVDLLGAPDGRLPAAVETAAYYVVSEALTNVAKYACAEHATVRMERVDGEFLVEISDDGVGGARADGGSGLRGLSDRVAALDGVLEVVSPPGGGTRLRVQLPCA